jgi:hypothetical protein
MALLSLCALRGFESSALGQYGKQSVAAAGQGWAPADYSAAYAPYTANYHVNSCDPGGCGPNYGCGAYGDGYGRKCGCGNDCGCGVYGGDCGCGMYGGDCGGSDCYGGDCGCDPYCSSSCDPCTQPYYDHGVKCGIDECTARRCRVPKVSVFGDYLYLQVSDADVTHAQQQDGIGGAGTVPFGDIGSVGLDWEKHSYRVGGSIACGPCSDVVVTYTDFDVDAIDQVVAPTIPGGGGAVGSLVHHPGAALTASAGPVDANYLVGFQQGDVMCRTVWREGPRHMVRWMLGGQYVHLDQDFAQNGIFGGGLGGAIDTSTVINFDGGGIKAGLDAERWLGHGVSVYGRVTASAMTGRFNSRYNMYNESTDAMLAQANWKDDRVVSQLEYEFGLGLTSLDCHWRGTIGYMLSYWDNVVTTSDFINAVQADNYTNVGDSITFDGFVSRVEYRW